MLDNNKIIVYILSNNNDYIYNGYKNNKKLWEK